VIQPNASAQQVKLQTDEAIANAQINSKNLQETQRYVSQSVMYKLVKFMTHKPQNRADVLTEDSDKLLCQTHSDVSHAQEVLLLTQETQQSVIAQLVKN
jgi:predicted nucleic-acid-binding protein